MDTIRGSATHLCAAEWHSAGQDHPLVEVKTRRRDLDDSPAVPVTLRPLDRGSDGIGYQRSDSDARAPTTRHMSSLAQALGSELWILDGPLARNAASAGLPVS